MTKAQYWFDRAKKEKFAIGAFNAASMETLKAIVGAAKNLKSPVMIEASHGEVDFFGIKELVGVCRTMEQSYGVPILVNLDHATDFDSCIAAIVAGFDYVHFDGGKLPFMENMGTAKELVKEAHQRGVMVEGEIDHIGGSSADHRNEKPFDSAQGASFTNPDAAAEFVINTGVDTFASFVGNVHGLYAGEKKLDLALLGKIAAKISKTYLSLHGGSGVSSQDIAAAISLGVVKINVNSELRVAFHDKLKEILDRSDNNEVAIYKIMPEAISAMQEIVEKKIKLFGSEGKI